MNFRRRCGRTGAGATAAAVCAAAIMAAAPGTVLAQSAMSQPVSPASTQPTGPVTAMASVEAYWSADQYAKISGYVSEVKADIGDRVTKGQVLAVIDVPEQGRELAAAGATLAAKHATAKAAEAAVQQSRTVLEVAKRQQEGAQAEQRLADVTLKRQEELFAGKAATSQQIDEARMKAEVARSVAAVSGAKIAAAEADVRSAEAGLAVAQANAAVAEAEVQRIKTLMEYTRIVAPFDGVVTRRQVDPGELVPVGMTNRPAPLFTVQQMDTVRVFCDVPEASATAVAVGDPAEVKLYGPAGQTVRGAVTRVATAVNPGTRTMRVEIDLPNAGGRLRPGMYAQVTLTPSGAQSGARVAEGAGTR